MNIVNEVLLYKVTVKEILKMCFVNGFIGIGLCKICNKIRYSGISRILGRRIDKLQDEISLCKRGIAENKLLVHRTELTWFYVATVVLLIETVVRFI